jgi:hypothetical protein
MAKIFLFFHLFFFSQLSFAQLAIQKGQFCQLPPDDDSISILQEAFSVYKETFLSLYDDQYDVVRLHASIEELNCAEIAVTSCDTKNSLSIAPHNYFDKLISFIEFMNRANENKLRERN